MQHSAHSGMQSAHGLASTLLRGAAPKVISHTARSLLRGGLSTSQALGGRTQFTINQGQRVRSMVSDSGDGRDRDAATAAHTNRLAKEESPYLLQHAHNPVRRRCDPTLVRGSSLPVARMLPSP